MLNQTGRSYSISPVMNSPSEGGVKSKPDEETKPSDATSMYSTFSIFALSSSYS